MIRIIPIKYREIYDVPRMIYFTYEGKAYLLDCPSDDRICLFHWMKSERYSRLIKTGTHSKGKIGIIGTSGKPKSHIRSNLRLDSDAPKGGA
jgi:hypothetical protein